MSLVGSLEDLGLGDILQIVSLARKSGRLALRTDGEAGWIILCDGQVRGAAIKGQSDDLRSLLVASGEVPAERFDGARDLALERDVGVHEMLVEQGVLPAERLDALRRERAERSVMNMFLWRTGEFSFEVRDGVDSQEEELMLSSGINTQYLAMQATRLRDEGELLGPTDLPDEEPLFSGEDAAASGASADLPAGEAEATDSADSPVNAMALASARGAEQEDEDELRGPATSEPGEGPAASFAAVPVGVVEEEAASAAVAAEQEEESAEAAEPHTSAEVTIETVPMPPPEVVAVSVGAEVPAGMTPIVALDGDLLGLEWLKAQAAQHFPRVHIFQTGDLAMDRVRRYLVRNVVPVVVASPAMLQQQDAGRDLLSRLRALAPGMVVLALLSERGAGPPEGVSGSVRRPCGLAGDPDSWGAHADRAAELVQALVAASRESAPRRGAAASPDAALENLRSVSDRLRDPERSDDVLTVVLEFAARSLARVAVFMLRDDEVMGVAENGMSRGGGPDRDALRTFVLDRHELPELFQRALETRSGVKGTLVPGQDAGLVACLGGTAPSEAWAAPIESGGSPVALVYGDNLPRDTPIGDTTALEIVLHEAGLALDRASLELALAAAQGEG